MTESHNQHTNRSMPEVSNDEIDLREVIATVLDYKFFVCIVTGLILILSWIFTLHIPPKYESTALLQVANRTDSSGISGALQSMDGMRSMLGQMGAAQPSAVETALLRSRYVLQPAVDKNRLNIASYPDYIPVLGSYFARKYAHKLWLNNNSSLVLAKPLFGLKNYAWGGEKLQVDKFEVPDQFLGKKFILQVIPNSQYKIYSTDGNFILQGKVGKLAVATRQAYAGLKILIPQLNARVGTRFFIMRQSDEGVIKSLLRNFTVQDLGDKDQTGVLSLSLISSDKVRLPRVLNTILNIEVKNNAQTKAAEAEKTLLFLNKQLPILRLGLHNAEIALDSYRAKTGSLGISEEGKILLVQIVNVEQNLEKLRLEHSQLLQEFTIRHPFVIAIVSKEQRLQSELDKLKMKLKNLPLTEQKAIALEREVKVKNQLYILLLAKIQQLQMVKAGTIGDVRILDLATAPIQLPNRKVFILLGGAILGFILSIMLVFIRKLFVRAADDPDVVEEQLGISSYAIIPHSKKQEQLFRNMKRKVPGKGPFVLATVKPRDPAIEGLRSLRTTLQFVLSETKNNVISIMGASPGIGKSFVSINLAHVLADSGKKVLLFDADLRKGRVCQYLTTPKCPGLAEILGGKCGFIDACHKIPLSSGALDFVASGDYPVNPSELLMTDKFYKLLDHLRPQYDVIVIDTPPVLAVTEGILIAKYSGTNLLMVGSGKDTLKELHHAVKRIHKNGVEVKGLIFNNVLQVRGASSNYGYNYYYEYKA